ncbi:hypothetical protein F5X98DRAFT_388775 [Xylaria grammica]|nr:hypothetical protein F5X98DRAFT_388775 [Xylaria grammica]
MNTDYPTGATMAQDTPVYTAQQVAEHNSPDDLWIVISGKVYDVSKYTDDHPGGKDILVEVSGRDATEDFDFVGHSEDAKSTLADYEIGLLAGYANQQSAVERGHLSSTNRPTRTPGHRLSWLPRSFMLVLAAFPASVGAFTWILRGDIGEYASKLAPSAAVSGFWSGFSAALLIVTCAGGMVLQLARRFDALWGSMLRNGTANAIGIAKSTGVLPSGSPLQRVFTGIPRLDAFLQSPVIFYDALTHSQNPAYRALLIGLFTTMQSTSVCMLVGGWKEGRRSSWAILEHLFWGVFNQSHGAAFVYPLYCFYHADRFSQGNTGANIGTVESADAEALLYTSIISSMMPLWLIFPAFSPCSSDTRQLLIASYRLTPAITAFIHPAMAAIIRRSRRSPLSKKASRRLVLTSLAIAGASAAAGHIYAFMMVPTFGTATLRNIIWPWATEVSGTNSNIIAQGCHLFLQNDWFVIAAAFIPFAAAILRSSITTKVDSNKSTQSRDWKSLLSDLGHRYVSLTGITLLFSPGAVLPLALASKV